MRQDRPDSIFSQLQGLGGEGDTSRLNSRNSALDEDLRTLARNSSGVLTPSPLTPLPRWGEGSIECFERTKSVVTIFCSSR